MSNFDMGLLDGVEASTGVREVPDDGDYNLAVSSSEYVDTKNGTGFKMKFTILDGTSSGVELNHFINIINSNSQAEQIGRAEMKALLEVTGSDTPDVLEGKAFRGRLIGEESSWTDNTGRKKIGVNLRVKMFMTTAGKNAKGDDVPEFVATGTPAKAIVAKKRAEMASGGTGSSSVGGAATGGSVGSQTSGTDSSDLDDEIPF